MISQMTYRNETKLPEQLCPNDDTPNIPAK
jgi:hypothetical protein